MKLTTELTKWLDSEEGQASIKEFANKLRIQSEIRDTQIERLRRCYHNNIAEFIEKVLSKYNSKEYRDREWRLGREPVEELKWLLYEYADKYGDAVDLNDERFSEVFSSFTTEAYLLDNFLIERIDGQGSFISITKI